MPNSFPEPCWGVSQEACEQPSAFATAGPNPFMLSGVFQRLLQYHFSVADNIEEPLLKGYLWTPSTQCCAVSETEEGSAYDYEPSRILIKPSWSSLGPEVQQLPTILIKRKSFRSESVALRNQSALGMSEGWRPGERHHMVIRGGHNIICKGGTGAEAELLGQEVFFRMLHFQQIIKKDFHLGSLLTQSVSELRTRNDESKTSFYTVVNLDWSYMYNWLVIPESPIIKRVAIHQTTFT